MNEEKEKIKKTVKTNKNEGIKGLNWSNITINKAVAGSNPLEPVFA